MLAGRDNPDRLRFLPAIGILTVFLPNLREHKARAT
jgi:hypothetical protein